MQDDPSWLDRADIVELPVSFDETNEVMANCAATALQGMAGSARKNDLCARDSIPPAIVRASKPFCTSIRVA